MGKNSNNANTLGNLNSLKYLDIRGNKFATFPESFCNLKKLEELFIFSNSVKNIPKPIFKKKFTQLKRSDYSYI